MEHCVPAASCAVQVLVCWNGPLTEMAIDVSGLPPLLVRVMVCPADVTPITVPAKVSEVADNVSVGGAVPSPLSATVTAFTWAVDDVIVSVACWAPVAAGVKVSCTVQPAPAARVAPQVVVPVAKLEAEEPVICRPTSARGAPPVLVTVSVSGALATLTSWFPKLTLAGFTEKAGGCSPLPVRDTVCVCRASAAVTSPVCTCAAVGT